MGGEIKHRSAGHLTGLRPIRQTLSRYGANLHLHGPIIVDCIGFGVRVEGQPSVQAEVVLYSPAEWETA